VTDPHAAVSIRAHFERFPATVKGAFVVRGEDANPHQVAIAAARCAPAAGTPVRPLDLAPVVLDAAPHADLFVPFELAVSDLEPGWYALECDADVDGVAATFRAAKRFVVPWPRSSVRRGTLAVRRRLEHASRVVDVDRVECTADSTRVHVVAAPPDAPELRLAADGSPLPVVEASLDDESGEGVVSAYPLLRSHGTLSISLAARGGPSIELSLP
jgi:hypothetical protein